MPENIEIFDATKEFKLYYQVDKATISENASLTVFKPLAFDPTTLFAADLWKSGRELSFIRRSHTVAEIN